MVWHRMDWMVSLHFIIDDFRLRFPMQILPSASACHPYSTADKHICTSAHHTHTPLHHLLFDRKYTSLYMSLSVPFFYSGSLFFLLFTFSSSSLFLLYSFFWKERTEKVKVSGAWNVMEVELNSVQLRNSLIYFILLK